MLWPGQHDVDEVVGIEVVGDPAAQRHVERLAAPVDAAVVLGRAEGLDGDVDVDARELADEHYGDRGVDGVVTEVEDGCAPAVPHQFPRGLDVASTRIDLDLAVAGHRGRQDLLGDLARKEAERMHERLAVDRVGDGSPDRRLAKQRTARVQDDPAGLDDRMGEEARAVDAVRERELPAEIARHAVDVVVRLPRLDLARARVAVLEDLDVDLVDVVGPRARVVRVPLQRHGDPRRSRGDVVRPGARNRVQPARDDRRSCRYDAEERHRQPRQQIRRRPGERQRQRVPGRPIRDHVPEERHCRRVHPRIEVAADRVLEVGRPDGRAVREPEPARDLERVGAPVAGHRRHAARDLGLDHRSERSGAVGVVDQLRARRIQELGPVGVVVDRRVERTEIGPRHVHAEGPALGDHRLGAAARERRAAHGPGSDDRAQENEPTTARPAPIRVHRTRV